MFTHETFGFESGFSVEIAPEFPGDGYWNCPTVGFDQNGATTSFLPRGEHLVVRFEADDGLQWVRSFAEGLVPFSGTFNCPCPSDLLVVAHGNSYLVHAD